MMTGREIRSVFLDFFSRKGHEVVSSSSLIPADDPTLLFTNAGMVQFKSVFLGQESRLYKRAVSSQKCMRAGGKHNDLENVGHTARHHTFFEMLGNFSFGDYFKSEAIVYAWELLTEHYRLPKEKLWATVYEEDDEAARLWPELTGIPGERIVRLGAKDNFWQMGDTGPCGPCSEIIIDQGSEIGCGRPDCAVGCDCDRYLEIWNLVFMQFDRDKSGRLTPLPKPSIDTGMGLERLSAVLQGKHNNFDTDLFAPIISAITGFSKTPYGASGHTDTAIRVIADHIRSITFLLSEGLVPSNEGRGYVLRRIIRRASRYAKFLNIDEPVLYKLCDSVTEAMSDTYPELLTEAQRVKKILRIEEERFNKTLEQGLVLLQDVIQTVRKSGGKIVGGEDLFRLYDTFGFPVDIARDVAAESGLGIDEPGFHREMEAQKAKARASWVAEGVSVANVYKNIASEHGLTEFTGYDSLESDANIVALVSEGRPLQNADEGVECEMMIDKTPCYGEGGGQIGDTGVLTAKGVRALITDTRKVLDGLFIHAVKVQTGTLKTGMTVHVEVDEKRRRSIMRNHTATHLLHSALRDHLGEHVKQSGSYVSPDRLRFDFTHFDAIERDVIERIEDQINDNVLMNIGVSTEVLETRKAIESGVTALFGEKYGNMVRVVSVSGVSAELCGGTHVRATGDIGMFKVLSEGSVASGIRRIEAVTGTEAISLVRKEEAELRKIGDLLKTSENPSEKVQKVLADMKELERELERLKGKSAAEGAPRIVASAREIDGIKAVAFRQDGLDVKDLRTLADNVRDTMGSGVLLLASVSEDQASMVSMVTKDLIGKYHAGDILKKVAALAGGRGGGKPDTAQGGTKEIKELDKALESFYDIIKKG